MIDSVNKRVLFDTSVGIARTVYARRATTAKGPPTDANATGVAKNCRTYLEDVPGA
jgi:hypothetical protein